MNSVPSSVNERFRGPAEHARHDRLLVARYGAGDAYPAELDEARELVGRCAECARLAADIDALRSATSALPAARRTRDFRLTAERAEQLRGSSIQRWLRRLAAPGLAPLRPLAGAALSIGLVLVVVGAALPTPAGELMALERAGDQGTWLGGGDDVKPSPAATAAEGVVGAPTVIDAPGAQPGREYERPPGEPSRLEEPPVADPEARAQDIGLGQEYAAAESTRALLITSGLLIGAISLGLLLLVVFARRRWSDPLLR